MSTTVDQKSYLQKYLGGPTNDKKKKKKKVTKGTGFKIIDDDLDLSKLRPLDGSELDILCEGEDAPQIAGIIDERPEEVCKLEQFQSSSKWRVINQDDGFNSNLKIEEIKRDVRQLEKDNQLVFGKMYSDSEDDLLSLNDQPTNKSNKQIKKPQNNSDSDYSPPRKSKQKSPNGRENSGSDLSPPRQHQVQRSQPKVRKASRWAEAEQVKRSHHESKKGRSQSPIIKTRRKSHSSSSSPSRTFQKSKANNSDSDVSPPRKSRKHDKSKHRSSDSDMSPPRNKKQSLDEQTNKRKSNRQSPDKSQNKRQRRFSPQRKSRKLSPHVQRDLSSPRNDKNMSKYRTDEKDVKNKDRAPPANKKMTKTLDGRQAGLQDATQLRQENETFKKREEEAFSNMTDEISGRNAKAVFRKGKRETSEDRQKNKEKAERQKELDEKYKKWSRGLKQIETEENRVREYLQEAAKPLARHRDDKQLERTQREAERAGDPMLQYMQDRKRERGELAPERPSYKGSCPPNRFNIRPGYRWDGVDRSNGYENKYFDQQSKQKAQQEEAYKWSTEDL